MLSCENKKNHSFKAKTMDDSIQYMQEQAPEQRQYYEDQQSLKAAEDLYSTTDMVKLAKLYLNEDGAPEQLKQSPFYKRFWGIFSTSPKLTFLRRDNKYDDIQEFQSDFKVSRHKYIMSIAPYAWTWNDSLNMDQAEIYFKSTLRRSAGSPNHIINERTMLATTISQNIRSNTESMNLPQKKGFLKRNF